MSSSCMRDAWWHSQCRPFQPQHRHPASHPGAANSKVRHAVGNHCQCKTETAAWTYIIEGQAHSCAIGGSELLPDPGRSSKTRGRRPKSQAVEVVKGRGEGAWWLPTYCLASSSVVVAGLALAAKESLAVAPTVHAGVDATNCMCVCGNTSRQHMSMCAVEPASLLMTYFCNATTGCTTFGIHKAGKSQLQHHLNTKSTKTTIQCMYVSALQAKQPELPAVCPLFPTPGQHCVARCHPQPPDTSTCRLACRHGTVVEAIRDGCTRENKAHQARAN